MLEQNNKILLFDGVCNLCNSSVLFVIKHDKNKLIKYASIQSKKGKILMNKFGVNELYFGSLIFIDNDKVYLKSAGALRVTKYLNGWWPLLYGLIIIPKFVRNKVYDYIAKNRYQWFGKKESCMVPSIEIKSLFIDDEN
ncbi:MAG TPA: DCC1-like thiol-disulfide oxidoreductase family protein [Bacteroidia bacterium]|nr:DCC1-like thiol-disulfide oxidoreductase family protein [Bacteroidia bacterium]